jgi:CO/xanthine dehydrogenase Mo-binding subunit
VISGDTDSTPFDVGIFGDRGTHTAGLAAKMAAMDAKNQILDLAAEQLEANREDLDVGNRKIFVRGSPERSLLLRELLGGSAKIKKYAIETGKPIIGKASINPEALPIDTKICQGAGSRFFSTYTFATNTVEVEMDSDTAHVSVLRAVGSHDCGTVINPDGVEGQIDGGMAIGLGYGLFEEMLIKDGQVLNPNLLDYKIPTALDMRVLSRTIVECYDDNGPFGAKGVGNSSTINMAPAIANAISTLTGVRLKELPVTPEKILDMAATKEKSEYKCMRK